MRRGMGSGLGGLIRGCYEGGSEDDLRLRMVM